MKHDIDIEKILESFRHRPAPRVKHSVLERFAERAAGSKQTGIWRRPVPLYLAAAQIIIALCLGFVAARLLPHSSSAPQQEHSGRRHIEAQRQPVETKIDDLPWEVAPNDYI